MAGGVGEGGGCERWAKGGRRREGGRASGGVGRAGRHTTSKRRYFARLARRSRTGRHTTSKRRYSAARSCVAAPAGEARRPEPTARSPAFKRTFSPGPDRSQPASRSGRRRTTTDQAGGHSQAGERDSAATARPPPSLAEPAGNYTSLIR